MDEKLLTPDQVAEKLQVSKKTVERMLHAGQLKGYKLGRLWRISEENVQDLLKNILTKAAN